MIARRTAFAAAAASLLPAVAAAQLVEPAPGRLEIVGLAPNACVVRTPPAASGDNMTFQPQGSAAGQITITETVDSAARPRGGSLNLVVPIVCNSPHRVVLTSRSGGMRRTGQPVAQPGPFAELLPYSVNAMWGPSTSELLTSERSRLVIDSAGARAGGLSLSFAIAPGGQPLVAGTYSDEIVLELQAAN